ncbi:hypothetical protein CLV49_0383 [Labedella gwakjiensis]|uniref:Uncharacterized protein n=1 Tax=Labedella gwakjiensis TaxID=390269 RepID=A0A2P8GS57_9MICO|nr:hypothetical protein [Labedella gwakjiensis]PSL36785.1 hypothetical protein CLV49_0383 [Labedella gwakjiensis]RUQ84295.1 hypothetical protein ELQ93_15895 [Labedella gwakjiensis]
MSAAARSGRRIMPALAWVLVALLLIVGSTAVGFLVGSGAEAVSEASPTTSAVPTGAPSTPTGSTPSPVPTTVRAPSSCTAAYTVELVEREGSGYLFADPAGTVVDEMADPAIAAAFESFGGLRCAWSYEQGSEIDMVSGVAEVPVAEMADLGAQLRASGAECVFVRAGLVCRTGGPDDPDDSTFVGEVHMLRDGLWTVHVGHWGVSEYASSMNDALFGGLEVDVPAE